MRLIMYEIVRLAAVRRAGPCARQDRELIQAVVREGLKNGLAERAAVQ
ncbi:hypothetical protein [Arthrobacter echini]|nr:hypothetical protein [Arthrobacter echini]